MTSSSPRSARVVTSVNGAVAAFLVAVLAAFALVVAPPSPPGIAEFAPQATKPITRAPDGQAAQAGTGDSACVDGVVCASPSAAVPSAVPTDPTAAHVPRTLQCYRWPDGSLTQTFDPQSPPCMAGWDDDGTGNGGSTTPGVTATTIRVGIPQMQPAGSSKVKEFAPLVRFFNSSFQLYGRQIQLVPYPSKQANQSVMDPQWQRADAREALKHDLFASLDFNDVYQANWTLPDFIDPLARGGVITVSGSEFPALVGPGHLAKHAPYQWSYLPTMVELMAAAGAMTCRQLAGRPASHAASYRSQPRTFAVLLPDTNVTGEPVTGVPQLLAQLGACGLRPRVDYYSNDVGSAEQSTSLTQIMVRNKSDGITSVLFLPYYGGADPTSPTKVASRVGYQPEWVTIAYNTALAASLGAPPEQAASTFGIAPWNKRLTPSREPWAQAYRMGGGRQSADSAALLGGRGVYQELLLLASGIQAAGPRLTAHSFAESLESTTFPNPGAAGPPYHQATVGFEDGSKQMVKDFTGWWYDSSSAGRSPINAVAPVEAWIAFCYVHLGRRHRADTWPRQDAFYQGPCR